MRLASQLLLLKRRRLLKSNSSSSSSSPKRKLQRSSSSSSSPTRNSSLLLSRWDPRDRDPNSCPYAPQDEVHLGSPKWPYMAQCKSFDDYFRQYSKIVLESEGFTSFFDPTSSMVGAISPCRLNKYVLEAAYFAVQEYNEKGANVIALKKILKANMQIRSGPVYYVTLEAADGLIYETKINRKFKRAGYDVKMFRLAKHYTPTEENNRGLGSSSEC